ncbi:MAG: repair protein NreA [Thermoproteota archaeon]|nr:repair protein NreA [Thermoproteota archaeon]
MAAQAKLFSVMMSEQKRNLCSICRGHRRLCGKGVCPIIVKAETLIRLEKSLTKENIFGASPPAIFVGSWNYPKVLAGPLVPPISVDDASIMDLPERWVDKTFNDILTYRLSLVRGKSFMDVKSAREPSRFLSTFQEIVMASRPTDVEMWFDKKPQLSLVFSSREAPSGPSASIKQAVLTENPHVPRPVDRVVSDKDLKAGEGILWLYDSEIPQQQITRMLSIGLLGVKKERRLVPTEWSITAIDDILGKAIHREILDYPWISDSLIFGHKALGNNVQILFFPSSWMFEAQEAWLTSANPNPSPGVDYEFQRGRKSYASDLEGAYYATRLPALEYLRSIRRQAGVIVFMEVYPEWIPLGVWRFREICREALRKEPIKFKSLDEALYGVGKRLKLPLARWREKSEVLKFLKVQTRLTTFF